jgi:hypothetical protein
MLFIDGVQCHRVFSNVIGTEGQSAVSGGWGVIWLGESPVSDWGNLELVTWLCLVTVDDILPDRTFVV